MFTEVNAMIPLLISMLLDIVPTHDALMHGHMTCFSQWDHSTFHASRDWKRTYTWGSIFTHCSLEPLGCDVKKPRISYCLICRWCQNEPSKMRSFHQPACQLLHMWGQLLRSFSYQLISKLTIDTWENSVEMWTKSTPIQHTESLAK